VKRTRHVRLLRTVIIAILFTLAGGLAAAPAQAAAYRYWGYFHLTKGLWAFASTGPADFIPANGSVEGWRFAVADENSVRTPRETPTFAALCSGTTTTAGTKRVGLVIDFGRPADSVDGSRPPVPQAFCVKAPDKATGNDVLVAAGATLRLATGLNCAIDGWPATGCGDAVAHVSAAAAAPDTAMTIAVPQMSSSATTAASTSSGSSLGLVLGGAGVVILIVVLGFVAWRRGRDDVTNE
jgi:hypothetical protein